MKILMGKQEQVDKEVHEVRAQPQLDDLSRQITDMMDHRKQTDTQTRLYHQGAEKVRRINEQEIQKKIEK